MTMLAQIGLGLLLVGVGLAFTLVAVSYCYRTICSSLLVAMTITLLVGWICILAASVVWTVGFTASLFG